MNLKRSSASRGELTGAMGATIQTVRKHEQQLAALIAGMQQLMDGQVALGEAFDDIRKRLEKLEESDEDILKRHTFAAAGFKIG